MFYFKINQLWITHKYNPDYAAGIKEMLFFPCWYITKFNSSTRNSAYSYYSVSANEGNYWYCYNRNRMCL